MDWTTKQTDTLKRLWLGGSTATRIAVVIGTSISSVRHKAKRMGLPMRSQPAPRKKSAPDPVIVIPGERSLLSLRDDECRYPFGDSGFTFCGRTKREGSSYCDEHYKICYQGKK